MGNLATIIDRFFQKKNANNFKIIILYLFFLLIDQIIYLE